jgi:FAD/FMN-containing dehydrogenase/Fe-S oxidoreductase
MNRVDQTDARALAQRLKRELRGEVRFDDGSRALYATDASNYRQVPIGVVIPRDVDDVVATVAACRAYDAPILARGGGTSLAGQCCNVAVIIDFSKYINRVLHIDPERRRARVEPGCVLDDLRQQAERHHLTFGPDPATHSHNTLGGMIGNNSCGIHSVMAGRTADNVIMLDVLLYDGTRLRVGATDDRRLRGIIGKSGREGELYAGLAALSHSYRQAIRHGFPAIPRRVSGYDLDELLPEKGFNVARALVGSEGTCAIVLEAELQLVPSPPARALLAVGFVDIYAAADHVPEILHWHPIGLEGMDDLLAENLRSKNMEQGGLTLLPDGRGWLLIEFGGETPAEAKTHAQNMMQRLSGRPSVRDMRLLSDPAEQHRLWKVRESGLGATAFVPGIRDTWPGWEDSAVARERLGDYLRDLRALLDRYEYYGSFYGHFGDGCVHTRITFDFDTESGRRKWRAFLDDAADLVVRHGGSLSGEHGDGQARAELLEKMYGKELVAAFREFKRLWDPTNRMNPGKVVDPNPTVSNLRLPTASRPISLETQFAYPADHNDFRRAALRCVGVGKCRQSSGGVMCPSYMATKEEMHSTRGRARLLFEMLHEGPIKEGWKSDAVHQALDLCLACKGCKSDCPVNVDMATYKGEFYAHYYAGRLRPRAAYAFGWIYWWCRLAARLPRLANWATQAPGLSFLIKVAADMASERRPPTFAHQTFRNGFRKPIGHGRRGPVILWPDTFNNHFQPYTLHAAATVLADAGYDVHLPSRPLCCGRPLYAWGWLDLARSQLQQVLDTLEPDLRAGVPIVGIEPACVASFRDELPGLLPKDPRAKQLCRQSYLLDDFLMNQARYRLPRLERRALVHVHCHHHALFGNDAEMRLLDQMGIEGELLDSGCCGMAGGFGFEAKHYEVSMQAGERVLLPAVRRADRDTLIITDGYSCREQIAQATDRRAVHLAEVISAGIEERRSPYVSPRPTSRAFSHNSEKVRR